MHLIEFEIFKDDGSVRYAQWAYDEDHAFEVLCRIQPECLNGFKPEIFEVLFQVLGFCFTDQLVYWQPAGEA